MRNAYKPSPPPDVLLDPDDLARLLAEGWGFGERANGSGQRYVTLHRVRGPVTETAMLSRYLLNAAPDVFVDHKDNDTRNNRRYNLRIATPTQNAANRSKSKWSRGTKGRQRPHSQYLGVTWVAATRKWQAACHGVYLGRFVREEDAGKAYDTQARKFYGEFAKLNFPESTEEVVSPVRQAASGFRNVLQAGNGKFFGKVMRNGKLYTTEQYDVADQAYLAVNRIITDLSRTYQRKRWNQAVIKE